MLFFKESGLRRSCSNGISVNRLRDTHCASYHSNWKRVLVLNLEQEWHVLSSKVLNMHVWGFEQRPVRSGLTTTVFKLDSSQIFAMFCFRFHTSYSVQLDSCFTLLIGTVVSYVTAIFHFRWNKTCLLVRIKDSENIPTKKGHCRGRKPVLSNQRQPKLNLNSKIDPLSRASRNAEGLYIFHAGCKYIK